MYGTGNNCSENSMLLSASLGDKTLKIGLFFEYWKKKYYLNHLQETNNYLVTSQQTLEIVSESVQIFSWSSLKTFKYVFNILYTGYFHQSNLMQRTKVGKLNGLSLLLDAEIFDYVYPDEVNMILKDFINTSLLFI